MQHHLDGIALRVVLVALGPVVTNGVGEDAARLVERGGGDAAADVGVPLEAVLGVLVPEVKRAVGAGRAEGAVDGVKADSVQGVHAGGGGAGVAVALEREVAPGSSAPSAKMSSNQRRLLEPRWGGGRLTKNPSPRHIE